MTGWPTPKPAVAVAVAILAAALDDAGVGTKLPRVWPERFVRVSRAGGGQEIIVTDTARLLIECWGVSMAVVEPLTNRCRAALRNAQGTTVAGAFIRGFVNEDGPVDWPDPDVPDMVRQQFHGDLLVSTS